MIALVVAVFPYLPCGRMSIFRNQTLQKLKEPGETPDRMNRTGGGLFGRGLPSWGLVLRGPLLVRWVAIVRGGLRIRPFVRFADCGRCLGIVRARPTWRTSNLAHIQPGVLNRFGDGGQDTAVAARSGLPDRQTLPKLKQFI